MKAEENSGTSELCQLISDHCHYCVYPPGHTGPCFISRRREIEPPALQTSLSQHPQLLTNGGRRMFEHQRSVDGIAATKGAPS